MNSSTVKKLGFWSIVLYGINSIIGTGIFLTPGEVISQAGTYAPVAYIIAGLFAAVLGLTFARAARYVKTNGAAYAYTTAAFGDNVGIYVGITRAVSASIAWGTLATAVVTTLFKIFVPTFVNDMTNGGKSTGPMLPYYIGGLIVLMVVLLVINFLGNRVVEWASNISTVGKLAALALVVLIGVIAFIMGTNNYMMAAEALNTKVKPATGAYNPSPLVLFGFFEALPKDNIFGGILVAVIGALYAFTGFESIANAAEDMENPEKNLPRAIPVALLIVGITYISVIVVGMLLGPDKIVNSPDTVKLAAAISNTTLQFAIVIGAAISMFGINIAASFGSPRIWVALADKGVMPSILSKRNTQGVPVYAFILTAVLAIGFPVALQMDVSSLAGLSVIVRFIQFILVPVAVIVMAMSSKKQWKDIPRNIVLDYIFPVVGIFASVVLIAVFNYPRILFNKNNSGKFLIENGWNNLSITFIILLFVVIPIGAYVYFYTIGKTRRNLESTKK